MNTPPIYLPDNYKKKLDEILTYYNQSSIEIDLNPWTLDELYSVLLTQAIDRQHEEIKTFQEKQNARITASN
jgi:hypothetical protein